MTEKEKMLAGGLYNAGDSELREERRRARHLTRLFNQTAEEEGERRVELLRELLGAVGPDIAIEPPFHCDYGANISVGARFYMNVGGVILDCNRVTIGDDVLCGPYVQIYAAYHPTDPAVRRLGPELAAPITIGNDVWIGGGAIICPGVTIGDGSTIGAGSVVVRDIPARVFAAGNPCHVIRSLDEA